MGALVIITCIATVFIIIIISMASDNNKNIKPNITEIHKCNSITDIVMAVNQGRIYPYFTGMHFEQIRRLVKSSCKDVSDWENMMQLYELMGYMPGIDLPKPESGLVDRISINLTKSKAASAITIGIKDFQQNKLELVEEMVLKFGKPTSIDRQFMIWRERYMVVNIDATNGSISVIDERLF